MTQLEELIIIGFCNITKESIAQCKKIRFVDHTFNNKYGF
jgi:hypothetical protein